MNACLLASMMVSTGGFSCDCDDFSARGYVGRFLGVDSTIALGDGKFATFVEHPSGKVEWNILRDHHRAQRLAWLPGGGG